MENDTLNRQRLARHLTQTLQTVAEHSDSSVIAVVGSWGSGKTTLLDAVRGTLSDKGWYTASHNPWAYADYSGAVAGFFSAIREAIPDTVLGKAWRESLGGWVSRAAPLGAAGGLIGIDASGPVSLVGALITGDRTPQKLRDEAAEGLASLERPVLVILDDLDRLEPAELLATFKLVRLLGRLPNVYYLIAYDEETLIDILMRTELVGASPGRARQYLEKMVQVRIDLPPLLADQQVALMNTGVDDLCAVHGIALTPEAGGRLQRAWNECLSLYLDQPRAYKRLFTQVDAVWSTVADEVDFVDFLLVTFLRTFEKGTYDLIVERSSELLGQTFDFVRREETHAARWERWQGMIAGRNPRHPAAVAGLLSEMFLPLRSARENMSFSSGFQDDVRRRRGVGSSEYFHRYVQIGLPAGDLPDRLVAAAADELRNGVAGDRVHELDGWLAQDPGQAVAKLTRMDELAALPARSTLHLLAPHYSDAASQRTGFLGPGSDFAMLALGLRLLERCDGPAGIEVLSTLAESGPGPLLFAGEILRWAGRNEGKEEPPAWLNEAKGVVAQQMASYLRSESSSRQLSDAPPSLIDYVYAYDALAGHDAARELLWEALSGDRWELEDLLGMLVPIGTTSNGRESWPSMGDFSVGNVDTLLGVDRVISELGASLDGPPFASADWHERRAAGVSLEARRTYAVDCLKRIRDERRECRADAKEEEIAENPGGGPDSGPRS